MRTYNNVEIFDDDSIDNVTFEDHETITRIPTVAFVKLKNWLEANHIPFKRLRKKEVNDRPDMECFFDGHHYRGYFAVVTNIKSEDLIRMALTLATEEKDDCRAYTSDSDYVEDDNVQKLMDLFGEEFED